jgi:hypothetical protein
MTAGPRGTGGTSPYEVAFSSSIASAAFAALSKNTRNAAGVSIPRSLTFTGSIR